MSKPVIAIDPGHGLSNIRPGVYDPGAVGNGQEEAAIVLGYALALADELARRGYPIFLTRNHAGMPAPVSNRGAKAQKADAIVFVSLHMNSANSSTATGTETIYHDTTDAALAAVLQKAVVETLGLRNRGLKSDIGNLGRSLAVFGFQGPAALIEIGFITNPTDLAQVLSLRAPVVVSIANAIEEYFRLRETRVVA